MSKIEFLRVFLNQRLIAAAEEIFGVVEGTIAEYQQEVSRTKEENSRLRSMLDVHIKPGMMLSLHRPDLQTTVSDEEEPSEQMESNPSPLPGPKHAHIKEEPRISQEGDNHVNEFINSYGYVTRDYCQDATQSLSRERYSVPSTSTELFKTEPFKTERYVGNNESSAAGHLFADQSYNRGHSDWTESSGPLSCLKPLKSKRIKSSKGQNSHVNVKDRKSHHLKSHSTPCVSWDATPSCKVCGKQLESMVSLLDHVRTHTQDKDHMCGVCGKFFQSTEGMIDHLQTHNGAKCCHVCGKYFAWDAFLKRHLRSHTGEKPFRCHYCGKGFTQCGHLNLHMRSHTGEKPHQCQDCGKCFSQNTSLIVHMRTHTGEKPYMCPVCRKGFTTSSMLKRHQTATHKHIGANSAAPDSVLVEAHKDGVPDGGHMVLHCVGAENQAAD